MQEPPANRQSKTLALIGALMAALFTVLHILSYQFEPDSPGVDRPLIIVMIILFSAFGLYAIAWFWVGGFGELRDRLNPPSENGGKTSSRSDWFSSSFWVVIGFGVLFRVLVVTSVPIQEIDLYRYILDGAVTQAGGDPYELSPEQMQRLLDRPAQARMLPSTREQKAKRLVATRPALREIIDTIHFGQYNSPYPPVSQAVFAVAITLTPAEASSMTYVRVMKLVLMLFDFGTALVVLWMLRTCSMSPLLVVGYWWCPLVIKEFTNSGHLDSIVVFLVALAIATVAWGLKNSGGSWRYLLGGLMIVLGIGAKFFPAILFPIWGVAVLRRCRWYVGVSAMAVCLVLSVLICWPLVKKTELGKSFADAMPTGWIKSDLSNQLTGLEVFAQYWEMNDLAFMVVVENLKQTDPAAEQADVSTEPWFVATSDGFRESVGAWLSPPIENDQGELTETTIDENHAATFLFTRKLLLAILVLGIACGCVWLFRCDRPEVFIQVCFLTLAWFWLLSPTQNAWYWIWALPFLPFVRSRMWFFISGLLFLYYLRFWCDYHLEDTTLSQWLSPLITIRPDSVINYRDVAVFDFLVPWVEFGPWYVFLVFGWLKFVIGKKSDDNSAEPASS